MNERKITNDRKRVSVKRPIQRSLLIGSSVFMTLLSVMLATFSYFAFSKNIYRDYDARLSSMITYIEHHADADDLEACMEANASSEKRDALQILLNNAIDDFQLNYIYIVVPDVKRGYMINAVSATSAAERAAGETDMPVNEASGAYTKRELYRYFSFWNAEDVQYFEETSDYGAYYTACKPLRNSSGKTVALICADLSVSELHRKLNVLLIYCVVAAVVMIGLFGLFTILWLRKNVTRPLLALEISTRAFAERNRAKADVREFQFDQPAIDTKNEVQSLGEAIGKMASDMRDYVEQIVTAETRIREKEQENLRLAEQAEAAAKIAQLTESVSALFTNVPAMTFSKGVHGQTYLACNRAFAEYVQKASPADVVGLRDADIFDEATAKRIREDDERVLATDKPYVFYEEVTDKNGRVRQMQTTKLKFTDPSGRLCILGMCVDITEMNAIREETLRTREAYEHARSESVTYSNIARALAADYAYIYYVDLTNDRFIEYRSERLGEELAVMRRGEDFFAQSRKDAWDLLYAADVETFIGAFTKENILRAVGKRGKFTLTYRLLVNGAPTYMNMKATTMENDADHLIIGVNNVDAQMRYQEAFERIAEERITYSRITALSGDYICIYTVNPVTDHYVEYSATKDYEGLGLSKEGDDFFLQSVKESARMIHEDDRNQFVTEFTKEKVLQTVREKKIFTLKYRLLIDGAPTYVSLKAALVEEKDGPQLLIGVSNIDDQVKREEAYERTLSVERDKATLDALTGLRNKHAYVDAEAALNRRINAGEELAFAIVVCDVNGLKLVNDTLGHHRGDELIKQAGEIICRTFKRSPVFRVGGDEFTAIVQGHDYERLDELVAAIEASNAENAKDGGTVIACGTAKYEKGDESVTAVFERADEKMYENKKNLKKNS